MNNKMFSSYVTVTVYNNGTIN